ncbi:MAG TPA: RtcB family protein, partial [Acidimicrobiales bacterium]
GIGNQLAQGHIARARKVAKRLDIGLEDPDLAYLLEDTPEFDHYVADLMWAQDYAARNRELMLEAFVDVAFAEVGKGRVRDTINCHHNYSAREIHEGRAVWVTRKGAIRAGVGDLGLIPGSMGTSSFIVEGRGNPDSYESCSHGAGRRMSRTQARKKLTPESLAEAMGDRTWLSDRAGALVDEHPDAYKDINRVMADQADLVEIRHTLRQVLNYKG